MLRGLKSILAIRKVLAGFVILSSLTNSSCLLKNLATYVHNSYVICVAIFGERHQRRNSHAALAYSLESVFFLNVK